jgi:hypothetical protein
MKRGYIIIILIAVLLIILWAYFLLKTSNSDEEVLLGTSIDIFEECINNTHSQFDCRGVTLEDVDKLKLLNGEKGIIRCDSSFSDDQGITYNKCFNMIKDCNEIFSIEYKDMGNVESILHSISINLCGKKQYYVASRSIPPAMKVIELKLDDGAINKLKE